MDTDLVLIGKLFNNVPRDIFNNILTIESTSTKFVLYYILLLHMTSWKNEGKMYKILMASTIWWRGECPEI